MSYDTGSIVGAATVLASAQTLADRIETALAAHPAWEPVVTFMVGSTEHRVWKCLGLLNSFGVDFFVSVNIDSNGNMSVSATEQFNEVNKEIQDFVPGSAVITVNEPDWTIGGTHAGWRPWAANSSNMEYQASIITNTINFAYIISVTNDQVLFVTDHGTGSNRGYVAGLHESWMPADKVPLFCGPLGASWRVGFSRALVPVAVNQAWQSQEPLGTAAAGFSQTPISFGGGGDPIAEGRIHFSRIVARVTSPSTVRGYIRGLYRDFVYGPVSSGVTMGDSVTLNGQVYRYLGANLWVRGAA